MKMFWVLTLAGILVAGMGSREGAVAQTRVPQKVMKYLESHSFRDLVRRYGNTTIELSVPSRKARYLDSLPYRLEAGFRVQVVATTDEQKARNIYRQVKQLQLDSTYLVQEQGLFKVQVGNFTVRDSARKLLDQLYYAGFKDAWIAPATIHIAKKAKAPPAPSDSIYFAIQVMATHSRSKAEETAQTIRKKWNLPVRILAEGNLFKVLAGNFREENVARQQLQYLREHGWSDAWLTQLLPN